MRNKLVMITTFLAFTLILFFNSCTKTSPTSNNDDDTKPITTTGKDTLKITSKDTIVNVVMDTVTTITIDTITTITIDTTTTIDGDTTITINYDTLISIIADTTVLITSDTITIITKTDAEIDSLINVLISRVEEFEYVDGVSDVKAIKFKELSDVFAGIVKGQPTHYKANVGAIVSSVLAINSSPTLIRIADSLDSYFSDMDDYFSSTNTSGGSDRRSSLANRSITSGNMASSLFKRKGKRDLYSKAVRHDGINGLGLSLMATLPEIIVARAEMPKIPKFITVSYIQDAIENEIIPVLDRTTKSFDNIEALHDTTNMKFVIDSETVELDMADIYMTDASIRALSAGLAIFTAYDWDLYTSSTDQSYSWVDEVIREADNFEYYTTHNLSLDGDTVIDENYYNVDTALYEMIYDVVDYNYNSRPGFLSIRKENHSRAYKDLLAVPTKLRKALQLLDAENDNQEDDLIKKVDISDLTTEMVDIKADMIAEGFSEAFAKNFESPLKFIDFVENILTGPFVFDETIDSINLKITIDISKFFTNPVEDFHDWVPLHKFRSKNNIIEFIESPWTSGYKQSYIWIYDGDSVNVDNIPSSIIDTITEDQILFTSSHYYKDDYKYDYPAFIDFLDDQGKTITMEAMLDSLENGKIAYFKDYTLNGMFPEMTTRKSWNDFIANLLDLM